VYTCPIKALVNEKFLSLCREFGPENVGMMTGDASVNPQAPVLCCTAEILANIALHRGEQSDIRAVIMDEFHYYSDAERGYAWQVPLLTMKHARFLLMSATLGDTEFFEQEMTRLTARFIGLSPEQVLVCSTGRIGVAMPMDNVRNGIQAAAGSLRSSTDSAAHFAEAIMTSDTRPKQIAVEFNVDGKTVRIGGACKGAGMIQPGMSSNGSRPAAGLHATMLGFVTTDAAIEHRTLKACLETAVAQSFNRITVDGDMSTNDIVVVLANGLEGNREVTQTSK
jgi:hypothetical protein